MGWHTHEQIGEDNTVHTWPGDDDPHMTEPGDPWCWCNPKVIEYDNGNVQVIHRDALDRLGTG